MSTENPTGPFAPPNSHTPGRIPVIWRTVKIFCRYIFCWFPNKIPWFWQCCHAKPQKLLLWGNFLKSLFNVEKLWYIVICEQHFAAFTRRSALPEHLPWKVDVDVINRFRNLILFLCDAAILTGVTLVLAAFSLRYSLSDAVGRGNLLPHLAMLYGCTVVFQDRKSVV